jgi:hypothetical protein
MVDLTETTRVHSFPGPSAEKISCQHCAPVAFTDKEDIHVSMLDGPHSCLKIFHNIKVTW